MNRAFLSLYLLVVVSLVVVGWGADRLWSAYNPEPEIGPYERLFFAMLDERLRDNNRDQADELIAKISGSLDQELDLYSLEELASSSLGEKISAGEIVNVIDEHGQKSSYYRVSGSDFFVRLTLDERYKDQRPYYIALLVAFYVVIAIIIYFWIWPLARDLKRLQAYTQRLGLEGAPERVELGAGSTVHSLASAFNKMAARIRDLLASHQEMTSAVSHELRTPLARIKFALQLARDSESAEVKHRQLDSVRQDVAEMESLISELLAYAGFEQKSAALEFKTGALRPLVEHVVASNRAAMADKNVHVEIYDQLDGQTVACEWYLLERCLDNLVQNAFKFCRGEVSLTLCCEQGEYQILIDDDGPGIEQADRKKVFQAFVRLRRGEGENISGFGLGLAIVARIMKWHGGGVDIDESPLKGARFRLHWPQSNSE